MELAQSKAQTASSRNWNHFADSSNCYTKYVCKYKPSKNGTQDKTINNTHRLGGPAGIRLTDKNMSMCWPVYMLASIATLGLAAKHRPGNGIDHLRIVEHPDAHIVFSSSCPSEYSLWRVIRYENPHSSTIYNRTSTHCRDICIRAMNFKCFNTKNKAVSNLVCKWMIILNIQILDKTEITIKY